MALRWYADLRHSAEIVWDVVVYDDQTNEDVATAEVDGDIEAIAWIEKHYPGIPSDGFGGLI